MMDTDGDAQFPSKNIDINREIAVENAGGSWSTGNACVQNTDKLVEDDEDDEEYVVIEDFSEDEDDDGGSAVQRIAHDDYECGDEGDGDDDDDDDGKRKRKSLFLHYEFAPRVPAPLPIAASAPKTSYGGRNPLTNWTQQESFMLLDAWGDRFLKRGRKNLRCGEWQGVTEKVNQVSDVGRTSSQCRNRLDTMKKKYKKAKKEVGEPMSSAKNWVYFEKMDSLLSCGTDSGEYPFVNPRVPLKRVKKVDRKMTVGAEKSEVRGTEDDSEVLPSKKKNNRRVTVRDRSLEMLADSIDTFSEIYAKIENSRIQQMLELGKMWMDCYKDLELHRNQILERARAEMAKIQQGDE